MHWWTQFEKATAMQAQSGMAEDSAVRTSPEEPAAAPPPRAGEGTGKAWPYKLALEPGKPPRVVERKPPPWCCPRRARPAPKAEPALPPAGTDASPPAEPSPARARAHAKEGGLRPRNPSEPRLKLIAECTAAECGLMLRDLVSRHREHPITRARQLAWTAAREVTCRSSTDIAYYIGRVDHTVVIAGIRKTRARIASDPDTADLYARILARIREAHARDLEARARMAAGIRAEMAGAGEAA
jgi:hypothetical protein